MLGEYPGGPARWSRRRRLAVASAVALLLAALAFVVFLAYQRNWYTSGGSIMPSPSAIGVVAIVVAGVSPC